MIVDEEIRRIARANSDFCNRESQKDMVRTPASGDSFYIGFLGEMAARRYFGLPLVVKEYLDYGYDFDLGNRKVEVKTSVLHEPLRIPVNDGFRMLIATEEKLKGADTILFAKLEPGNFSKTHLIGWIEANELNRFPVLKYGRMPVPAYAVYFKYIRAPSSLKI